MHMAERKPPSLPFTESCKFIVKFQNGQKMMGMAEQEDKCLAKRGLAEEANQLFDKMIKMIKKRQSSSLSRRFGSTTSGGISITNFDAA